MKFKAIRNVHSPERDSKNAGYDLFTPEFDIQFLKDFYNLNSKHFKVLPDAEAIEMTKGKSIMLYPNGDSDLYKADHFNIKIPTGIKYKMNPCEREGFAKKFEIKNKSGIASKHSIVVGACVCDEEYQDEVIINLIGFKTFELKPNFKIAQGVISEVSIEPIEFIPFGDDTEIFTDKCANRGGGFGSTGTEPRKSRS